MDRFRLKTTMDGSKSRRRGPKQNDTPASNHRQQLNRNAQRTHRERKEIYVKDLEKRVSDYKAMIIDMDAHHSATQKELEKIMEENRTLKELLSVHHNIHFHDGRNGTRPSSNGADASVLELTFQGHTPPARMGPTGDNSMYRGPEQTLAGHMGMTTVGTFPRPHVGGSGTQVNQVQIGVDFVLE